MTFKGKGVLLAVGLLGSILAAATPAWAQGHGGGGGGGGGHAAGGGGGHAVAGGHSYAGAPGAHYAGTARYSAPAHGYSAAYHGAGYAGHGAYGSGYPGHYYGYGHGYSTGAYWRGGYWRGGYWPRAYYGWGFAWFLPVLPLAYATYWYGGVPYYYANDVYYTYNPSYDGYVATDPPPVADSSGAGAETGAPPDAGAAPNAGAPAPLPAPSAGAGFGPAVGQIFMYPKNGQSPEQQATDKAECQKWAAEQAGQVAQNAPDYQRAMVACVEGRGYSAR